VTGVSTDSAGPRVPGASPQVLSHSTPFGFSLSANPLLSMWVEFTPDRRVLLRVGKVELGQGIVTALSQIAAEELDVDWSRVQPVPAATPVSPDEGLTAGSRSIMDSGSAVRAVCAEVRRLVLVAASAAGGVPMAELRVVDGEVQDPSGTGHGSYWSLLAPTALDVGLSGNVQPKDPARHSVVGRSLARPDLVGKLTGAPEFVHDLALPGQLYGRVVRPPSPAACLLTVDDSAARALGSVVTVVREGSFLGVVADREEEAIRAAAILSAGATWQESETLPDQAAWTAQIVDQPAEEVQVERRAEPGTGVGPVEVFRASYRRAYTAHASIGPGCAVARWTDDRVSVWTHSQGIFPLRRALAACMDLDPERVDVHHVPGAGCYGHNSADDVAYDAARLARAVPSRPVQVVWSRADEFGWEPYGSAMVADVEVGVDDSGDLASWRQDAWGNGHDSRPGYFGQPGLLGAWHAADAPAMPASDPPLGIGGGTGRNAAPPYSVPDLDVRAHRLLEMPLRTSALRGLGAVMNVFAIESAMDELAARIGVDPLEYRLRQLPDDRARRVLEVAAEQAGWADRTPEDSVGWGLAYSRYKGICGYCAVVARVEAVSEVRVTDLWVAVDAGQVINPDGLMNQMEGGAIQATSWALREQVTFDSTRVTSRDWESYPILRFGEIPDVHVTLVPRPDEPPLGAGELTGGPVAAAVANALADAIGVRVRELPLTPERIAAVIEAD
jgi:nicotinate dehydrogenase subunit B